MAIYPIKSPQKHKIVEYYNICLLPKSMKNSFFLVILFSLLGLLPSSIYAQTYTITGKITDAETGEAVPFANVYLQKSMVGITTDFDGYFTIKTNTLEDSLVASYIGYIKKVKILDLTKTEQNVDFQLLPDNAALDEVEIVAGENPAWDIMRQVLANKNKNDKRNLAYYEYESYSKTEVDIDNVSEKFGDRKAVQKVMQTIDSIGKMTGDDGKPLIPIFMAESISKMYYNQNPEKLKEEILKRKITGVGVEDDGVVAQIIGSSFQDYNFYKNWIRLADKDFVSPAADGWKLYYEYYLIDSVYMDDRLCYQIEIEPKNELTLAFKGTIWIDKETFAFKQIDLSIDRKANINFIEKIKIQQEFSPTDKGPWVNTKNRILIDIGELSKNSAGVLAKFYVSNTNINTDSQHEARFFEERLIIAEDANENNETFWQQNRHDPLTTSELQTYAMIDTIKNIPAIKSYIEIIDLIASGYKNIGKYIEFGNYLYTYAYNNVEGHRIRLGFRTTSMLSKYFTFNAYGAYGTQDQRWKYGAGLKIILQRRPWTEIGIQRREDIAQIAINEFDVDLPIIFLSAMYFNKVQERQPYIRKENLFYIQREVFRGFTQKIEFRNHIFETIDTLTKFAYYQNPKNIIDSPIRTDFINTEIEFEARYARRETYLQNGNERILLESKSPIFTFRYTLGLPDVFGSNFSYHKFYLNITQKIRLGNWGTGVYSITGNHTPSQIPYPLLYIHLGNQNFFYNRASFNQMRYIEFVSDSYIHLSYEHNFNGLFLNKIPLLKKLKWREFIGVDALMGSLRQENIDYIPLAARPNGLIFGNRLSEIPYVEMQYGVENIFKFLRVHFIHRLTHLDLPNALPFSVRVSARIRL
ncbi:MAG: carboxypeptidase-like regulatory domain-containing protein [Cytophagales bacterium]|nr:MAG: carboxypeptidase-like regulatory domain-containing protein [Cytophagales bacterium]